MNVREDLATVRALTMPWQEGGEVMTSGMVPEEAVARWEDAYRTYMTVGNSRAKTRAERLALANALQNVADAWRAIADTPGLAWWQLAALSAASETAEHQARQFGTPRPWAAEPQARHGGESRG